VNPDEAISLQAGDTETVQIRVRNGGGSSCTMLGAKRAGTVDDRIYLTIT